LAREKLKIGPGEVGDKKINRPISLGKEGLIKEKCWKIDFSLEVFRKR